MGLWNVTKKAASLPVSGLIIGSEWALASGSQGLAFSRESAVKKIQSSWARAGNLLNRSAASVEAVLKSTAGGLGDEFSASVGVLVAGFQSWVERYGPKNKGSQIIYTEGVGGGK